MNAAIQSLLDQAVADKLFTGAILASANQDDPTPVVQHAGTLSTTSSTSTAGDTVVWVASLTKLVTAIAVMQLVEKGELGLDSHQDVARLLPEFAEPELLTAFDPTEKTFEVKKASRPPTLRELLTHTSGLSYDLLSPALTAWRASKGQGPMWLDRSIDKAFRHPLVCEPGDAWNYGPSTDWAGKMVERATNESFDRYCQQHVFDKLNMTSYTFDLESRPDLMPRYLQPCTRAAESGELQDGAPEWTWNKPGPGGDARGGGGLYTTASDYMQILTSLLKNDGVLLRRETVTDMLRPTCGTKIQSDLHDTINGWLGPGIFSAFPKDRSYNYSLAGCVFDEDVPGLGQKGTAFWNGLPHCFWILSPKDGYCAVFLCSFAPSGDPKIIELIGKIQAELYKASRRS